MTAPDTPRYLDQEPGEEHVVLRARRRVALRVSPRRPCPGIARELVLGGLVQSDLRAEAQPFPAAPSNDTEPRGLALEPVLRDRGRLRSLVALDHGDDGLRIAGLQPVGVHLPETLPIPQGRRRRVGPMQEHQVGNCLLVLATLAPRDMLGSVAAYPRVHLPRGHRVAPAQIGVDDLPREIVRIQAVRSVLHERQGPQPREQLLALALAEDGAQQPGRGQPRVGHAFQREPVARTRHPGQEALHQPSHHVGGCPQLQGRHIPRPGRLPLREHVDQERECERVAV